MAEGWFGFKDDYSGVYSIRQTDEGILIQAIADRIKAGGSTIKADNQNSYQFAVSSKQDVQTVINLFSFSNLHPMLGHKAKQYNA